MHYIQDDDFTPPPPKGIVEFKVGQAPWKFINSGRELLCGLFFRNLKWVSVVEFVQKARDTIEEFSDGRSRPYHG